MIRAIDKWLLPWLFARRPRLPKDGPVHVMLAVCDHFEPLHGTDFAGALRRIGEWRRRFPGIAGAFRDAGGQPPKHTFFYPVEQYRTDLLEPLAELCRETGSEVEIHLHHENDTPAGLAAQLDRGKRDLRAHGLLSRDPEGDIRFAFIHGNWALNNSDPRRRGCGVDREIPILRRAGCYADFTMPSAPHPAQARIVNSIYHAKDRPGPRAHDRGTAAAVSGTVSLRDREDHLLMIQGPLCLNWRSRKWGLLPRLENADLTGANPPTGRRMRLWLEQGIGVQGRPDWLFVKLHTHGGIPRNYEMLLGEPMKAFHRVLATLGDVGLQVHYVTAREMANIVFAAEDGCAGSPDDWREYLLQRG